MEAIISLMDTPTQTPLPFGWFHLLFLALSLLTAFLLVWRFRDCGDKTYRRILMLCWILMVVMEVYKQLTMTFDVADGEIVKHYQWYAFPYQFCSTPYLALPMAFLGKREGKIRDAALFFLATYSLFAGLAVLAVPSGVFCGTLGINIQSMLHHGCQFSVGVFVFARERKRFSLRGFGGATLLFLAFSALAIGMNEFFFYRVPIDGVFNMFFISRHFPSALFLLDRVWEKVSYPVFLCIYLLGFAAVGLAVFAIGKGIVRSCGKRR